MAEMILAEVEVMDLELTEEVIVVEVEDILQEEVMEEAVLDWVEPEEAVEAMDLEEMLGKMEILVAVVEQIGIIKEHLVEMAYA